MITASEFENHYAKEFDKMEQILEQDDDRKLNLILQKVAESASIAFRDATGTHLPRLDRILLKIADIIRNQQHPKQSSSDKSIILVSELYSIGGHSRIVEDMIDLIHGEVLVIITDYVGRYASGKIALNDIYKHFKKASVLTLPMGTYIEKVMSLTNIIKLVSPGKLYLLLHHPDSIGYVAAFAHKVNGLKSFFIHHADHNPTLGATLHYEKHLDTTKEYALKCNELNCDNCHVLPLYVKDKGP